MKKFKDCLNEQEIINEYIIRIKNELKTNYDLSESQIDLVMEEYEFYEFVRNNPDQVMYYSPKYWAKDVMYPDSFM